MPTRASISQSQLIMSGSAWARSLYGGRKGLPRAHILKVQWGGLNSPQGYPAPAAAAANNICTAQAIAGAVNAVINGTLAATNSSTGAVEAVLDCPRTLQMVSSNAGDTTQTVTVTGVDALGRAVVEARALNGTTIVNFTKCYARVTRIAVSAALAGNLTFGSGAVLGLPVHLRSLNGDVLVFKQGDTVDAATFVAGDTTTPSATTNDPLGRVTPAAALNGATNFSLFINASLSDDATVYPPTFSG